MTPRRACFRRLALGVAAVGLVAVVCGAGLVAPGRSWAVSTPGTLLGEGGSFDLPMIDALQNSSGGEEAVAPDAPAFFNANVDQARDDFASGDADYAVSEFPLTSTQAATAAQNGRTFAYVPFAADPLAIAAIVECNDDTTLTSTTLCPNLEVSVPLLAEIFSDAVSSWNDPKFSQASGGRQIVTTSESANIHPVNQVAPSMANYALQSLFVTDPIDGGVAKTTWDTFLGFLNVTDDTPNELWPTNGGLSGGDQSVANSLIPVNEQTLIPQPNPQEWGQGQVAAIPMDWTGSPYNLPTIAIQNEAGAYVPPGVASMTAAVQDATMDPTTNLVTFTASTSDTAAYPIPTMSYLVVPTSGLSADKATALAQFIRYVLGPGQAVVQSFGAASPTQAMVNAGLKVAEEVAAQATSTTTTTTTTTTATTATTGVTPTTAANAGPKTASTAPSGAATADSAALAFTGAPPWMLPGLGAIVVIVGELTRRGLRRRMRARGAGA